jgi:hypothetical protein
MTETFHTFLHKVEIAIINPIITLLGLAAFVLFVWGVVEFIANAGNEEKRKIGQQHMIWGIVGLVIMFGARAIVAILTNTFGIPGPTQ